MVKEFPPTRKPLFSLLEEMENEERARGNELGEAADEETLAYNEPH
jgi:hypothetical protein